MRSSRPRIVIAFVLFSLLVLSIGCTHTYTPTQKKIGDDRLVALTGAKIGSAVALESGATDREKFLGSAGSDKWVASETALVDMMIQYLTEALRRSDIPVEAGAPKTLRFSLGRAHFNQHPFGLNCTFDFRVETGGGGSFTIRGTKGTLPNFPMCFDGALVHAAISVLQDAEVIEYLSD